MTAQLDLFGPPKVIRERRDIGRIIEQSCHMASCHMAEINRDKGARAKLGRMLRGAAGGLVNGMNKAALRRYAPERLPRITVHD
jgi:hypothetical protein